jgi:hypothetical protein
MAGSWLKMRHDLIDAPEIRRLAKSIGVTKDDVYGKLFRLWSWFDRHSVNGVVAGEELEAVDELIGTDGFAAALVSVGWLAAQDDGIVIPNWERHNSETAKERALAAVRQERTRGKPPDDDLSRSERDAPSRSCHGPTVTRLEKTREEILPSRTREAAWEEILQAWKAGPGKAWNRKVPPDGFDARLADPTWVEDAKAAIQRLPQCRWFKTPVTMIQLCASGFVDKVLAGTFDEERTSRRNPSEPDDADRRAALDRKAAEFAKLQPAPYRRPREAAALAQKLKLKEESA